MNSFLEKVEGYVLDYLNDNLRKQFVYHSLAHTLRVVEKTKELAALENIEGVIILKIEKNSIIENTNMEREFIITMVNNEKIKSLDDFTNAIANAENEVILDGFYEKYPGEYTYVFDKD